MVFCSILQAPSCIMAMIQNQLRFFAGGLECYEVFLCCGMRNEGCLSYSQVRMAAQLLERFLRLGIVGSVCSGLFIRLHERPLYTGTLLMRSV